MHELYKVDTDKILDLLKEVNRELGKDYTFQELLELVKDRWRNDIRSWSRHTRFVDAENYHLDAFLTTWLDELKDRGYVSLKELVDILESHDMTVHFREYFEEELVIRRGRNWGAELGVIRYLKQFDVVLDEELMHWVDGDKQEVVLDAIHRFVKTPIYHRHIEEVVEKKEEDE